MVKRPATHEELADMPVWYRWGYEHGMTLAKWYRGGAITWVPTDTGGTDPSDLFELLQMEETNA